MMCRIPCKAFLQLWFAAWLVGGDRFTQTPDVSCLSKQLYEGIEGCYISPIYMKGDLSIQGDTYMYPWEDPEYPGQQDPPPPMDMAF